MWNEPLQNEFYSSEFKKLVLEVNDTHKKDAYLKARLQKSTAGMELAESEINLLIWDLRAKSHK